MRSELFRGVLILRRQNARVTMAFRTTVLLALAGSASGFFGRSTGPAVNNAPLGASTLATPPVAAPKTGYSGYTEYHRSRLEAAWPADRDVARLGSLEVPHLALGTISWTPEPKEEGQGFRPGDRLDGKVGTSEAQNSVVHTALRLGANFFDTAERYSVGAGESLLADALASGAELESSAPVGPPVVATKFTPTPWRRGAESVVAACEASRRRLGVEQIDLYMIHMPDVVQPGRAFGIVDDKNVKYWEGLARCKELGLVKEIGVSNYGPTLLRECAAFMAKRGLKLATNQIHYSLMARRAGGNQAAVDAAKELGITTLAYYPLAMGLLTASGGAREGALKHYARGGVGYIGAPWLEKNQVHVPDGGVAPLVAALERVADARGKTVTQVALNWIMAQGVIPIAGATTDKYVADAAGALGWRLSPEECAELEAAADDLGFEFQGTFFKRTDSKFVGYGVEYWTLD